MVPRCGGTVLAKVKHVSTNHHTSKSILASVASHEQSLLAQLDTSEQEARETIEQARVAARNHLQQSETALNDEMATLRRERQARRLAEFQSTVSAADAELDSVRASAASAVDKVAKDVLALFLPRTTGGN